MSERTTMVGLLQLAKGFIGLAMVAGLLAVAILASWFYPGDPLDMVGPPLLPLSFEGAFPLGTDRLGRDIAAGLAHGARTSIVIAALTAVGATLLGVVLGAVAGYGGGWVDVALMRVADALQAIPSFLIVMIMVMTLGPTFPIIVLAVSLTAWTLPARATRAEMRTLHDADYVAASRLIGRRPLAIALLVMLPNALTPALSLVAVLAGNALLTEAALSFLGLGNPNTVSWGSMIAEGRAVMRTHPHVMILPGLALFLTVWAIALIGDRLDRRRLQPSP